MSDSAAPAIERRAKTSTFVLSATGLAILLSIGFFPSFFKAVTAYDDEGSLLVAIGQFMHHGSLYVHTHGSYGPFYFTVAGLLFRLTGHDPILTNGRFIVLGFTALSAVMFAATVWRITRSVAFSLLCEVATYIVLVRVAGTEPMHPGSMVVLLVSVLGFALASYAMEQHTAAIIVAGATIGALTMVKVNVGIFAAVAVIVAFVVGNSQFPKLVRVIVAAAALLLPFVLMTQLLYQLDTVQFAVLVSVGLLATYVPLSVDSISISARAILIMFAAAAGAIGVSCIWPLATGSSPSALFHGVVIQPLAQVDHLQTPAPVNFELLAFILTVGVVYAVLARRNGYGFIQSEGTWQYDAALGAAGLSVLALAVFGDFGAWLPAIAVLPALAWMASAPPFVRLALRFLVPLAILQFLHAYPVAGSQVAWARVAVCVPCTIAMAAAMERFPAWSQAGPALRALAVGSLGLVLVVVAGFLPLTIWRNYHRHPSLGLPGAALVKSSRHQEKILQELTAGVRQHCDTFYSAPGFASLYIYTGIPSPTGMLADVPGALNASEQREIVVALDRARANGQRVCIVRDTQRQKLWLKSSYGHGPLGKALARYRLRVAKFGRYTVSHYSPRKA